MGGRRGAPLRDIKEIDERTLQYLRSAYDITTLEEVVEIYAELKKRQISAETLQHIYNLACKKLGDNKVSQLEEKLNNE